MLSIQFIREHPEIVKQACKNKLVDISVDELLALDESRRHLQKEIDSLQHERKILSEFVTGAKPSEETIQKGKALKEKLSQCEEKFHEVNEKYRKLLSSLPNLPSEDTPIGKDENDNQILRSWGEKRHFSFIPKAHWLLGEARDFFDNERATKVVGSRFTYLKGDLVMLQLALIQYTFDLLTNEKKVKNILKDAKIDISTKPFIPILPPVMMRPEVMNEMARLEPKEERYHISSDDLYLIGSAEHTLGPLHKNEIFSEKDLPIRYLGYSTSFRREAGSYGKDVKGILRMHQFDKIEMESFTLPEDSLKEQEFFVAIQEYLMQSLEIPYQIVICCTGDMGGPDARHLDLESWMPGQDRFRETHSADLMTDYQSRRLNIKVNRMDGRKEFVHMNDATALAMGRTLIAIMENYQNEDSSIEVPKVLQKYMRKKVL